jgi:flagellar hook-associated protein 2
VTASGIGSGVDVAGLVSQLVAAERSPVSTRLDQQEAQVQAKISAYGILRSALAQFQGALEKLTALEDFLVRKSVSGDTDVFTVSATSSAAAGSYEIQVERLARGHKVLSPGIATSDEALGTGTLTVSVGGASMALTIDASNNTLAGIRDAINGAADNPGVTATLISVYDDVAGASVSKLVLTSRETGAASAISVTVADDDTSGLNPDGDTDLDGLSRLASPNLTELRPAQDALVWLDGQKVVSASNTVEGAIDGVTLSLKGVSPEDDLGAMLPATLDVTVDEESATALVEDFVAAYNGVVDALKSVDSYNASSRTASALFGDSVARALSGGLRRALSDPVEGLPEGLSRLADLGVTAALDGKLTVNGSKLGAALARDVEGVGRIFAGDDGLATRLDDLVSGYLDAEGILKARTDGLDRRVKDLNRQREALAIRMESLERRLLKQFTAMDELVAQLQSTGNFLTQQLSTLQSIFTRGKGE